MGRLIKSFQQMGEEQFGSQFSSDQVVNDLAKALTLGSYPTTAGVQTNDAGPLRLQNLDATLTSVLFTERHIKFWNTITKVPSIQPYYEWNRRRAYGSSRHAAGFAEGGTPKGSSSKYERNGAYTRFMGVRRGITHQLTMTGQLGGTQLDPVAEENRNGAMELLAIIERQVLYGDTNVLDQTGATVNYDGFIKQMKTTSGTGATGYAKHIVDKAGAPLDFTDIEEMGYSLFKNGLVMNFDDLEFIMTPSILTDLSKMKFDMERKILGASVPNFVTGVPLAGHDTNFGRVNFNPSIFTERVDGDTPLVTADPNAPATPGAWDGATQTSQTGSKFTKATAVVYSIAAFNDSGESLPKTQTTTNQSVAASGADLLTFPAAPTTTTGWRVYRGTATNGSDAQWIADVAVANATYQDLNTKIPGTGIAVLLNKNPETLAIAQMTPLVRFPLAITTTTIEWLLLLYHTLVLKAGERVYLFENVGRLS
jgi:hypothetical protein